MENSSPFQWDRELEEPTSEQREAALQRDQEKASRFRRVFKENPEGAAILDEWRAASVDAVRGPGDRPAYTLGYIEGRADLVRQIDHLIRFAETGYATE